MVTISPKSPWSEKFYWEANESKAVSMGPDLTLFQAFFFYIFWT